MKKTFTAEDMYMGNKHMLNWSTSLAIRESKTTISSILLYKPKEWLSLKIVTTPNSGEDAEKIAGKNIKHCNHSGKLFDSFFKEPNHASIIWPNIWNLKHSFLRNENLYSYKTCTWMFIALLFIISPNCK